MKDIPRRYRDTFTIVAGATVGICTGDRQPPKVQCRHCGAVLYANTAGMQSHVAKHVREREAIR